MPIDIEKIRALAQIVSEYGLSGLELSDDEGSVSLKRDITVPAVIAHSEPDSDDGFDVGIAPEQSFNDVTEIKSPMVGIFYAAPSPDEKPFTAVGAHVRKGDVLCVIEAMKLMNEITAPEDCEIVDVCAENGQIVEYGQTLFKIIA